MEQTSAAGRISAAKAAGNAASRSYTHMSVQNLIAWFCAWKSALLLVAVASPGPGYDTSTELLLDRRGSHFHSSNLSLSIEHIVSRLTRWDAIYFASSSEQGHVFEQEWAFSGTFARLTSALTRVFPSTFCSSAIICHALAGIVVSHIAHLLAVLFLYKLTYEIIPSSNERKRQIAFTAACLHVLSPAGLFLSAPYGESMFAAAHFAGLLCYVLSRKHVNTIGLVESSKSTILIILSGLFIGFSSMIRSNGLLSGSFFAWDAISFISLLPTLLRDRDWTRLLRLAGTILAGILIAIGYVLPQIEAYQEFCTLGNTRPWCDETLPSIYTFVQSHYWNVGFLRYWTLSNLPLFLLATPMLLLLTITSLERLYTSFTPVQDTSTREMRLFINLMARLALPQLILTVLATTSFHVQIINRISSGYPVWYIMLAIALLGEEMEGVGFSSVLRGKAEGILRGMVVYAVVQGGLYASFMPPA